MPINEFELTTATETIVQTFCLCVGDNYVGLNIIGKVNNDLTHGNTDLNFQTSVCADQ